MEKQIKLELEQEELHTIIKNYFGIDKNVIMESDTNAGITIFEYKTLKERIERECMANV